MCAAAAVAIESRGTIRGSDHRGKSHGALQLTIYLISENPPVKPRQQDAMNGQSRESAGKTKENSHWPRSSRTVRVGRELVTSYLPRQLKLCTSCARVRVGRMLGEKLAA